MAARISYRIPTVVGVNKGGRVKPGEGERKAEKKVEKEKKEEIYPG